jgi:hypothetical protein
VAATPEGRVKTKIKKILKDNGVYYAMPIGTGYGSSGVPDFLCCVNGNFLAIEAKAGKGTTTALQEKNLREIKECGGTAAVIAEEQLEYLEQLIQLMKQ